MNTTGHKVLITGGTRGIGLAMAEKFATAGNDIVIVGSSDASVAAALGSHPDWAGYACDLASRAERESLLEQLHDEHSDLSVLINNAGVQDDDAISAGDVDALEREVDINITAVVHLSRALAPTLGQRNEGAIVNVSSGLAIAPKAVAPIYCASKAFVRSYCHTLRYELEGSGVSVFDLAPPLVITDMTAGRNAGGLSAEALVEEFWRAWQSDRHYIPAGKTKLLEFINRLSPALARSVTRNM